MSRTVDTKALQCAHLLIACSILVCVAESTRSPTTTTGIFDLFKRTHVVIRKNMGDGSTITIHCKSRDDDLGDHVLKDGETYEFGFRPNFFIEHHTIFSCTCKNNKGWALWDAYHENWGEYDCKKVCPWRAAPDGIHGEGNLDDTKYNWGPPPLI